MKYTHPASLICSMIALLFLAAPHPLCAHEGDDWKAFYAAEKTFDKKDDAAAIAAYSQFLQKSKPGAVVGCLAYANIADRQRAQKQFEQAIATCEDALEKYPREAAGAIVVTPMTKALRESGKSKEAAAVADEEWPILVAGARSGHGVVVTHTSLALREIVGAHNALAADEQADAATRAKVLSDRKTLLQKMLIEMPIFLDDRQQGAGGYFEGWMHEALFRTLDDDKKEQLGWAKVYYQTCAFDAKAIERATKVLSKAWAANDDFAAVRLFARAQEEPIGEALVVNPLHRIAPPQLSHGAAKALSERLVYLATRPGFDRNRSLEIIALQLLQAGLSGSGKVENGATGRTSEEKAALRVAMENARKLLAERPDDAEGPQQVCRIFKAADGDTRRANRFIAYLNGQGENPLPAFFDEMK